jgi:hypothetical protein
VISLEELVDQGLFVCPCCRQQVLPAGDGWRCSNAGCQYSEHGFPMVSGKPALVDFENSVLNPDRLHATGGASEYGRKGLGPKLFELL